MRKFKKTLIFKTTRNLFLILRDFISTIRSSRPFKWFYFMIRIYAILFAAVGSGLMGFQAVDLQSYSMLVYETVDSYLQTFKQMFKQICTWIFKLLFGEHALEDLNPQSSPHKTDDKIFKRLPKNEGGDKDDGVFDSLRKYYKDANTDEKKSWSRYIWDGLTSPYVMIPVVIGVTCAVVYVKYDDIGTTLTALIALISGRGGGGPNANGGTWHFEAHRDVETAFSADDADGELTEVSLMDDRTKPEPSKAKKWKKVVLPDTTTPTPMPEDTDPSDWHTYFRPKTEAELKSEAELESDISSAGSTPRPSTSKLPLFTSGVDRNGWS